MKRAINWLFFFFLLCRSQKSLYAETSSSSRAPPLWVATRRRPPLITRGKAKPASSGIRAPFYRGAASHGVDCCASRLRSCPWWPRAGASPFSNNVTESPAIGGPHTLLRSLLPDSILTEGEEASTHRIDSQQPQSLSPTFPDPRVHPESSAWTPGLPWTSPPTGHTHASKTEPVIFLSGATLPFVTPPALRTGRPERLLPTPNPYICLQTLCTLRHTHFSNSAPRTLG